MSEGVRRPRRIRGTSRGKRLHVTTTLNEMKYPTVGETAVLMVPVPVFCHGAVVLGSESTPPLHTVENHMNPQLKTLDDKSVSGQLFVLLLI